MRRLPSPSKPCGSPRNRTANALSTVHRAARRGLALYSSNRPLGPVLKSPTLRRSPTVTTTTPDEKWSRCGSFLFPPHLAASMVIAASADFVSLNSGRHCDWTGNLPRSIAGQHPVVSGGYFTLMNFLIELEQHSEEVLTRKRYVALYWRASRLPSVPSALRGLDPRHPLPRARIYRSAGGARHGSD